MKKALFLISIVTLTAGSALAQTHKVSESQEPSVRDERAANNKRKANDPSLIKTGQSGAANATGNTAANVAGSSINAGTALSGELQNSLDVRRSKVGDRVVLKTLKAVKQNGHTIVPKGSQLVGRITDVAQRGKNNSESRIGMIFDRIQGGDLSQPISASIVSITSAAAMTTVDNDLFSSDIMGSSSSSGSVSRGSRSSGGGLLGGTGGLIGGATNTVGGVANTATNTVGGVTDTATRTVGGTTRGIGNTVNGLRISGAASGSANSSTTISSGDKNLHIDKGATFNLIVNK